MVDPPASPGDDSVMTMVHCSDCGHMVPESNLTIHQATACVARARARRHPSPSMAMVRCSDCGHMVPKSELTIHQDSACVAHGRGRPPSPSTPPMRQRQATAPPEWQASGTSHATRSTLGPNSQNHDNHKKDDTHEQDNVMDFSNVRDDKKDDDNDVQVVTEWPCPQCTLLNPTYQNVCSVCQYAHERPADPVRRDRLVRDDSFPQFMPSSPGSFVGGGALLGSVIGAAGAYMRGNSLGSGVLEGAMTGAMGGAVADSLFRSSQQTPVASSRSSSHHHQQQNRDQYSYQQPRSSFRVSLGSDMTTTTTMIRGPHGSSYRTATGGDPLLALMMANMFAAQGHGGADIDAMSYEQLLQAFGDGSENRGADESAIASLPTSRIAAENADCENADHAKCSICLETFETGESKKMLPCLHGFHAQCVDRWLRSNASCPICKHHIS